MKSFLKTSLLLAPFTALALAACSGDDVAVNTVPPPTNNPPPVTTFDLSNFVVSQINNGNTNETADAVQINGFTFNISEDPIDLGTVTGS